MFSYFLWNVSKTCEDGLKISRSIEIECLFHSFQNIFFHELETFETRYQSIINCMQLFSMFSIFLCPLILFKFAPLWIAIYLIGHHWLCFIFSICLNENGYFQRKKCNWWILLCFLYFDVFTCHKNNNYCQCK